MKKRKTLTFPMLVLIIGGLLLILFAAFLLMQSKTSQTTPTSPVSVGQDEETYPEIERVSLEDSKAALDAGTAVFVDVRGPDVFDMSHVPGALSIPLAEINSQMDELDPNQWIITYCTWPSEESSARAARILLDNGFKNVTPLLGGFNAWRDVGYPTE